MKKIYDIIHHSILHHESICSVPQDAEEQDIRHAIRWVMRDNPNIYWFSHQYHFDTSAKTVSFIYTFSEERCRLIQNSIDDVIRKDFRLSHVQTLKDIEKVMYVYKWLLDYCNYNIYSAYNQNIVSVFMRRNSVCTGYAKAAQHLFQLMGLNSCLVFGRLNNDKNNGRHCWNIIEVNSKHYHIDVCLGDTSLEKTLRQAGAPCPLRIGSYNYNCFCVSTHEILKTRSIEDIESLPDCPQNLSLKEIEQLSELQVKKRNDDRGCLLTNFGSSADIFLSTKDKNTVLKVFHEKRQCMVEYGFINHLTECRHLLQHNSSLSDIIHGVVAIEQSTPIVDLLCSHYYHPTLHSLLLMTVDITKGWLECLQRGIFYRDIHICNIYRSTDGTYKLGDFGSCIYTMQDTKEVVGNQWFMAPETYLTGHFDERSAIYGITSVLYFILNGMRPPFLNDCDKDSALQYKMEGRPLPMPSHIINFPKATAEKTYELICKGCAYHPSERFTSCKELLDFIMSLLTDSQNLTIGLQQSHLNEVFLHQKTSDSVIKGNRNYNASMSETVEEIATTAAPPPLVITEDYDDGINVEPEVAFIDRDGATEVAIIDCDGATEDIEDFSPTVLPCPPAPEKTITSSIIHEIDNDSNIDTRKSSQSHTYLPKPKKVGFWERLFGKKHYDSVYSSIFAPAEARRGKHLLIQIYLHLHEETERIEKLAAETDKDTERRDYIPLQCKLKKDDTVDIMLSIYGEKLLMSQKKSLLWQGSFTKCSFDWLVPKNLVEDEMSCQAVLAINGAQVGEMSFIIQITEHPKMLNPEVFSRQYKKIFISYAHQDEDKVKMIAHASDAQGVDYFFDRHYLKPGAIFPLEIEQYIDSADRFILCWSANAAKSDYVKKEMEHAMKRAFPKVKPIEKAPLSIYPLSIEPRADELPDEMRDIYNFEII